MTPSLLRGSLAICVLAALASAGEVHLLTPDGYLSFSELQPAVDAGMEGDTLLVAEGSYDPVVIDGKSLSIFAFPGQPVGVQSLSIRNLGPDQVVVVSGIYALKALSLHVESNDGLVRIQDASFGSSPDAYIAFDCQQVGDGAPGALISNSARVLLSSCSVGGGTGVSVFSDLGCDPGLGGSGVAVNASTVALYDCEVTGGLGGGAGYWGAAGGPGLVANASVVFVSGTSLTGGRGYNGYFGGSAGGDGAQLSTGSELHSLDCTIAGGAGGTASMGTPGPSGQPITGAGAHHPFTGRARTTEAATLARAGESLSVTFSGEPGDTVWVPRTTRFAHVFLAVARGVWLTEYPPLGIGVPSGVAPRTGERLVVELPLPPSSLSHETLALQGVVVASARERLVFGAPGGPTADKFLTSSRHVLVLEPTAGPDCNANGVNDYLDVLEGTSADSDHDLVPDECP